MRSNGVTQIEVITVILIIGILISLLLPAIQAARETARRSQCMHYLLQLGLAVRNYESTHGRLPAGVVEPGGPVRNVPIGFHHNWLVAVLPWILPDIALHVRSDRSVYDPENLRLFDPLDTRGTWLRTLQCPTQYVVPPNSTSYAGCHDDRDKPIDEEDHGVFVRNRFFTRDDIPDGLAHTIFLGEKLPVGLEWGWMSGTRATLRNAGVALTQERDYSTWSRDSNWFSPDSFSRLMTSPTPHDVVRFWRDSLGRPTPLPREVQERLFAEPADSQSSRQMILELLGAVPPDGPVIGGFGSFHPGVVNILFGDLSIKPLRATIDLRVLGTLAHRSDGEGTDESF